MMEKDNSKKKTTSSKTTEPQKKSSTREKKVVNNEEKNANSSEKRTMEIEINKYKQLVDAINDPKKLAKVIVVITVIVVLIFWGISMVSLMLKKFYPYKAISTIQSGATIIENEDTEVIYWLFNSADLWSNSGIEVKEGDVITVRASGAFHTAIHHAVQDADNNNLFRDDWILPMGGRRQLENRDSERMKYRIMPHAPDNVLLMQIIPDKESNTGKEWLHDTSTATMGFRDGLDKGSPDVDIVIIGEEKRDIRIPHDGILHFAVNDIVLTERNIQNMMKSSTIKINKEGKEGKIGDTGTLELGGFPIPRKKKDLEIVIKYMKDSLYSTEIKQQRFNGGSKKNTLETDTSQLNSIIKKWDEYSKADSILKTVFLQTLSMHDYDSIVNSTTKSLQKSTSKKAGPFSIPSYKEVLDSTINFLKKGQIKQESDSTQECKIKELEKISKEWDNYQDIHQKLEDIINRNLTELDYYRMHKFVDAWFVDNVGSILIAIERKKK